MKWAILLALLLTCGGALADSVPLKEEHGTFVVPVLINDKFTLTFTIDSGASDVSIPADVFSTLTRAGTVLDSDLLDKRMYVLADGSKHESQRFRIRSLKVGSLTLRDVAASVAPQKGTLLLGQSFLGRLQSWSIDNKRHLLVFNQVSSDAVPLSKDTASTIGPSTSALGTPDAHAPSRETDWKYIATTNKWVTFFDAAGLTRLPDGHMKVWVKALSASRLDEIDGANEATRVQRNSRVYQRLADGHLPPYVSAIGRSHLQDGPITGLEVIVIASEEDLANTLDETPQARFLYELDCGGKEFRTLSVSGWIDGQFTTNDEPSGWKNVPPESGVSDLLKMLCKGS